MHKKSFVWWMGLAALTVGFDSPSPEIQRFPEGFLWGAATSSHQVEGDNTNNDWAEWESKGKTRDPSGRAAEHWSRFSGDFDLARELKLGVYRMSVEWSRIEPKQDEIDERALAHYRVMLQAARSRGMKICLTLHHFTNPLWASAKGGWENPEMIEWFERFSEVVVARLGDLVDLWVTINEPNVLVGSGYMDGSWPPGKKEPKLVPLVMANLLKGHAKAYKKIHAAYKDAKVGFAHHMRIFEPADQWNPADRMLAESVDKLWNTQVLEPMFTGKIKFDLPMMFNHEEDYPELKGTLDFIGINYYSRDFLRLNLKAPGYVERVVKKGAPVTDIGWEIYPEGLFKTVEKAARFKVPIYITENGLADAKDEKRVSFLCDHLKALDRAIKKGFDVRGYMHWALLDNFEWFEGYGPRFGLIGVDYATQKRTVREGAKSYRRIIEANSIEGVCPKTIEVPPQEG